MYLLFSPFLLISKSHPTAHNRISSYWTSSWKIWVLSVAQRRHVPVSNAECGPAGLASVQMCQRKSRASGSCPTEWHSRGQPNSHLCIVCHALAVQVLTCGTRLCFSVCHECTLTCSYTVTQRTLHMTSEVLHLFEVTVCELFSRTVPLGAPLADWHERWHRHSPCQLSHCIWLHLAALALDDNTVILN